MSWWNLGGLNPNFKEFTEKYPNKTLIGVGWAFYWRFAVLFLVIEAIIVLLALVIGALVGAA